jgi:transposase-like protein
VPKSKREYWARLVAEQEAGGQRIRAFCRERGVGEHSFYQWRQRLRENPAVRFALLETKSANVEPVAALELVLANGERLRIGDGVDAPTLRVVLDTVRR